MKHGQRTGEFGSWLTNKIKKCHKKKAYKVFYDHGNKKKDKNVCAIKGFYSNKGKENVHNSNRLADVDVIIANNKNELLYVIEIEERQSSPKKILGDVCSILLCDSFAIKIKDLNTYFKITKETKLLIYGVLPGKGSRIEKYQQVISPRIAEIKNPPDSILSTNVQIYFKSDIDDCIVDLKKTIHRIL